MVLVNPFHTNKSSNVLAHTFFKNEFDHVLLMKLSMFLRNERWMSPRLLCPSPLRKGERMSFD